MEYIIEPLKATVASTKQVVTGRLTFTQVLGGTQIVQYSADINRKTPEIGWIPRFECNEQLEILPDMFTKVVVPKIGFGFNAYGGDKMLIGAENIGELPEFFKEVVKDDDLRRKH